MTQTDFSLTFYDKERPQDERVIEVLGTGISSEARPRVEQLRRAHEIRAGIAERAQSTASGNEALQLEAEAKRIREAVKIARERTNPAVVFSVVPHAGLTTISAPYDYEHQWQAPDTDAPSTSIGDPAGGLMTITGESSFPSRAVNAVAGVGLPARVRCVRAG